MTKIDSDITISDAIQREIDTLVNVVIAKRCLCSVSDNFSNTGIKNIFTDNCNAAINNINNMIIAIAENISYLQVEHNNESGGDSNDI